MLFVSSPVVIIFITSVRVSTQTLFGLDFGFWVSTFWVLAKKSKTTFWPQPKSRFWLFEVRFWLSGVIPQGTNKTLVNKTQKVTQKVFVWTQLLNPHFGYKPKKLKSKSQKSKTQNVGFVWTPYCKIKNQKSKKAKSEVGS